MKANEKKGILILIVAVAIILVIVWAVVRGKNGSAGEGQQASQGGKTKQTEVVQTLDDGSSVNVSNKLNADREAYGYEIKNIKFTEKGGETTLTADVTNKTGSDQPGFLIDIVLLDKSGKELSRIPGIIVETQAGETIGLRAEITENYVNAYDLKIVKK